MEPILAFCNDCQKKVLARPLLLTDDDLRLALDRNEDVRIGHPVYNDDDRTSADHIWSSSNQEKDDLRKSVAG